MVPFAEVENVKEPCGLSVQYILKGRKMGGEGDKVCSINPSCYLRGKGEARELSYLT